MMFVLTELEQDALREMFNIGIGRASASLGRMVDDELLLSVPRLAFLSRKAVVDEIDHRAGAQHVAAVRQSFEGALQGEAILLYPEENSLTLLKALLGQETPLEGLTELERDSLMEVGNILLNACLGAITNMLEVEIVCSLPEYQRGKCASVLERTGSGAPVHDDEKLIFLIVDFLTRGSAVKGYVVLLLDIQALTDLKRELRRLTGSYGG